MITLVDVKKAVIEMLKTKFPTVDIVAQSVTEGFNKPAFFVQVLPTIAKLNNNRLYTQRALVVINFFAKDQTKAEQDTVSLENLKMSESLKFAFFPNIKVKDRSITVGEIESKEPDKFLAVSFSVRYIEAFEVVDDSELMQELNFKNEVK